MYVVKIERNPLQLRVSKIAGRDENCMQKVLELTFSIEIFLELF